MISCFKLVLRLKAPNVHVQQQVVSSGCAPRRGENPHSMFALAWTGRTVGSLGQTQVNRTPFHPLIHSDSPASGPVLLLLFLVKSSDDFPSVNETNPCTPFLIDISRVASIMSHWRSDTLLITVDVKVWELLYSYMQSVLLLAQNAL